MAENIKSMIETKSMFHTVQTVIQAKNLPKKEKQKLLASQGLKIEDNLKVKKGTKEGEEVK